MKKVELRTMEQTKYEIIKNLVDNNGNKRRAAIKLGITIRQVNRLIQTYIKQGKAGFVHGNRGRLPKKTINATIQNILDLGIKVKYNQELGKNLTLKDWEKDYDAIFLAFGANKSTKMNVKGEELNGVFGGNELLEFNGSALVTIKEYNREKCIQTKDIPTYYAYNIGYFNKWNSYSEDMFIYDSYINCNNNNKNIKRK